MCHWLCQCREIAAFSALAEPVAHFFNRLLAPGYYLVFHPKLRYGVWNGASLLSPPSRRSVHAARNLGDLRMGVEVGLTEFKVIRL